MRCWLGRILFIAFPDAATPEARADVAYRLAAHVERVTGNEAQVFAIDRSEVARRIADGDVFVRNVIADGILIFGEPLHAAAVRAS